MMNCSKNGIRTIGVGGKPPPGQQMMNGVIDGIGVTGGDVLVGVAVGGVAVVVTVAVVVVVAVVVCVEVELAVDVAVAVDVGVVVRVGVMVGVGVQMPEPLRTSAINRPT
jgi:hypothetical protein